MNKKHDLKRRDFRIEGILGAIILTAFCPAMTAKATTFYWTNNNGVNTNPEVVVGNTTVGTGTNIDGVTTSQGTITITLSGGSSVSATGDALANTNGSSTSTITNLGTIHATGDGIDLDGSGLITNSGTIASTGGYGIFVDQNATLVNTGTITNSGGSAFEAIRIYGTSTVTNYGTITGTVYGVGIALNSTLINYGTISGPADSVFLNAANGTVIVKSNSVFDGTIEGAGQTNAKLEFQLTGLTGLQTTQFTDYLDTHGNDGTYTIQGQTYTWADFGDGSVLLGSGVLSFASQAVTPNQRSVAVALDNATAPGASLQILLNNVANSGNVPAALDELSPQKLQVFSNVAFDNFGFTAAQVDNHTASLRYGQGGLDTSGLQVLDSSMPSELSQIKSRLLAFSPAPVSGGLMSDSTDSVLGGVKMTDPKNMQGVSAPATDQNRWSAFISGNVILADVGSDADVAYSHYTTGGVTAGSDYRINDNWAVGGLFSYGHTAITLDDNGSTARVDSYSPGIYATYADQGWYANGLFAYNYNSYGESRAIPVLGDSAHGSTAGNQYNGNLDGGYEFHNGNLTFGPTAALQYVHLDINSFTEAGGGALDINSENADSLRSRIGGQMRYNWSWYGGKVTATPYLAASWQHEYLDNSRGITSQFDGAGLGSFTVDTTDPDRDSAVITAGLDTQWNSAFNLFLDYQVQAGQSDFFAQSIEGGAKVSF
jgi:outer membrane autotransporter protein